MIWQRRADTAEDRADYWAIVLSDAIERGDDDLAQYAAQRGDHAERMYARAVQELEAAARVQRRYEQEKERKKQKKKRKPVEDDYGDYAPDDAQIEWEFGFEYEAHETESSNVDVNFRVEREDGNAFSAEEAQQVMRQLRLHDGVAPRGYRVTAINWRHPDKDVSFKETGNVSRATNDLVNVLRSVADQPGAWRLGGVR